MTNTLTPSRLAVTAGFLLLFCAGANFAHAESSHKYQFEFTKVVDSTQGYSRFQTFPAINNKGSVAFIATRSDVGEGIFRSKEEGQVTVIASEHDDPLHLFSGPVSMNASGTVAFAAFNSTGSLGIFTGDGKSRKLIADSTVNGLLKIGMGSPSINAAGTVAFQSKLSERGLPARVFTGNGGALTTIVDGTQTGFRDFGNVAINDSGKVVFRGIRTNGVDGIFTAPGTPVNIVDNSNHPEFGEFGDPVINNAGTVADLSFLSTGGVGILSGNTRGFTLRNNPANPAFTNSEHPSINNHGAVAFYGFPLNDPSEPTGIFLEVSGGQKLIPVIKPGDRLFGSTVASVTLGRFALNDRFEMAFNYSLTDGRSGIAIAAFHGEKEDEQDK